MEPERKRHKVQPEQELEVGDSVRLVNLPAFPGLEGLTAVVTARAGDTVDVELSRTKVVKRLKTDKVRKLHVGCIVELHGLVAAYKLNGQIGECVAYDEEQQRYSILLDSGETKKVKPQNVHVVRKFRSEMISLLQLRALTEELKKKTSRSDISRMLTQWDCVLPSVVSAKVLFDWAKLDDVEMQRKLLKSKKVDIATLPDQAAVVFFSLPRKRLVDSTLYSDLEFTKTALNACKDELERKWNLNHLYVVLSTQTEEGARLPMIKRGIECSFPVWFGLVDATVMVLRKSEDLDSLRYAAQRMDIACSHKCGNQIILVKDGKKVPNQKIKLSLPSRGNCDSDQVEVFQAIQESISIERPVDNDEKAYVYSS